MLDLILFVVLGLVLVFGGGHRAIQQRPRFRWWVMRMGVVLILITLIRVLPL